MHNQSDFAGAINSELASCIPPQVRQPRQTAELALRDEAQKLSSQLEAAKDRIAELEAEVRLYREKAVRAEEWIGRISTEIEDRLINEPEVKQRLH